MVLLRVGFVWAVMVATMQVVWGQQAGVQSAFERDLAQVKQRVAQIDSALTEAERHLGILMRNADGNSARRSSVLQVASQLQDATKNMQEIESTLTNYYRDVNTDSFSWDQLAIARGKAWPERGQQISRLVLSFSKLLWQLRTHPLDDSDMRLLDDFLNTMPFDWGDELTARRLSDILFPAEDTGEDEVLRDILTQRYDISKNADGSPGVVSGPPATPSPPRVMRLSLPTVALAIGLVCFILRIVYLKGAKAAARAPLPQDE